MNLVPWRRNHEGAFGSFAPELGTLRNEFDTLFDQFARGSRFQPSMFARSGEWFPPLDMKETEKDFIIKCEVPGLTPKDVEIALVGHVLTIRGEKKLESVEEKKDQFYFAERSFGSFTRSVELPETVDTEHVEAEQKDGLLTIKVKKLAGTTQKKVPIRS